MLVYEAPANARSLPYWSKKCFVIFQVPFKTRGARTIWANWQTGPTINWLFTQFSQN